MYSERTQAESDEDSMSFRHRLISRLICEVETESRMGWLPRNDAFLTSRFGFQIEEQPF